MGITREGTDQSEDVVKNWAYPALGLLLAYAFVRSLFAAAGRPFWYDELLTQTVAGLGSWQRIMEALRGPADGQPPLFYVIEHFATRLCANQQIALRLPSAAGLLVTLVCVFVYARKLGGAAVALLCSTAVMLTCVFQSYAEEARPYSMVLALVAFAMVCNQRSRATVWVVLFGMSLALAEALHYLAVLAMVPFGVAELLESWRIGKVRWGVWAALAFGALPLAWFWNLLQLNKAYYGAHHYYGHFSFSSIPGMYAELLGVTTYFGGAIGLTVLAAISGDLLLRRREKSDESGGKTEASEAVLLIGFTALPFFAFLFTKATHSAMTSRYILPTVLGLVLGTAFCMRNAAPKALSIMAVFILAGVGISELRFWKFESGERQMVANKRSDTAALFAHAGYADLPVVVPNAGTLLGVVYYAFPETPQRFVYLQADGTEKDADQKDTAEKGLIRLQKYAGIRVPAKREFLAENSRFLVYVEGANLGKGEVTAALLEEGWTVKLVGYDGFRGLFLVSRTAGG